MSQAAIQGPAFDDMLKTIEILRGHYARVVAKADTLALRLHVKGKIDDFKKVRSLRNKMREEHDAALDLIADKLTTPDELKKTRAALNEAKKKAHKFVKSLKSKALTLKTLAEASGFLTTLVKRLAAIL
ncbi:MAG: hypothetical protein AAF566_07770 [Pseudomonadota bacterium]